MPIGWFEVSATVDGGTTFHIWSEGDYTIVQTEHTDPQSDPIHSLSITTDVLGQHFDVPQSYAGGHGYIGSALPVKLADDHGPVAIFPEGPIVVDVFTQTQGRNPIAPPTVDRPAGITFHVDDPQVGADVYSVRIVWHS
jgi:hypothetical protein